MIDQVWELSKLWYHDRLSVDYHGRSIEQVAEILRQAGLMSKYVCICVRRDKSLPQFMEALRADGESALADFHALRQDFSPHRTSRLQRFTSGKV
jgi:hypothetical protein